MTQQETREAIKKVITTVLILALPWTNLIEIGKS